MKYKKPKWNFQFYKTYQFEWKPYYSSLKELLWKDKYNTPRCEIEPYYRFEWLWFGFIAKQGSDQEWEQWLWVYKYHNGDVELAKKEWSWVDAHTKMSTWNDNFGK